MYCFFIRKSIQLFFNESCLFTRMLSDIGTAVSGAPSVLRRSTLRPGNKSAAGALLLPRQLHPDRMRRGRRSPQAALPLLFLYMEVLPPASRQNFSRFLHTRSYSLQNGSFAIACRISPCCSSTLSFSGGGSACSSAAARPTPGARTKRGAEKYTGADFPRKKSRSIQKNDFRQRRTFIHSRNIVNKKKKGEKGKSFHLRSSPIGGTSTLSITSCRICPFVFPSIAAEPDRRIRCAAT